MCSKAEYEMAWRWVRTEAKLDAMREAAWDVLSSDPYPEIEKYEAWQRYIAGQITAENRWDLVDYAERAFDSRVRCENWCKYLFPGEGRRHKTYRAALINRKNTETIAYWWRVGKYTYIGEAGVYAKMLREHPLDDIPF